MTTQTIKMTTQNTEPSSFVARAIKRNDISKLKETQFAQMIETQSTQLTQLIQVVEAQAIQLAQLTRANETQKLQMEAFYEWVNNLCYNMYTQDQQVKSLNQAMYWINVSHENETATRGHYPTTHQGYSNEARINELEKSMYLLQAVKENPKVSYHDEESQMWRELEEDLSRQLEEQGRVQKEDDQDQAQMWRELEEDINSQLEKEQHRAWAEDQEQQRIWEDNVEWFKERCQNPN